MSDLATCSICLAEKLGHDSLDAAYGRTPPALPNAVSVSALACQRSLDKAAYTLARDWTAALGRCELGNASGRNVPPLICASDPQGLIARAHAKAGTQVDHCTSFATLSGCATGGTAAAVKTCMDAAVADVGRAVHGGRLPMRSGLRVVLGVVLTLGALALPRVVAARPLYFDNLVSIYGLTASDEIHACGVCHRIWDRHRPAESVRQRRRAAALSGQTDHDGHRRRRRSRQ
jgi:hypothetical protein